MRRYIILLTLILCMALVLTSCDSCGEHEHNYKKSTVLSEATCYSLGQRELKCSCDAAYIEEIGYLEHSFKDGVCTGCGASEGFTFEFFDDAGDYYTLTGYEGSAENLVVPKQHKGLLVLKIGDNAFVGSSISSIILPDTLQEIGEGAFLRCQNLKSIALPSTLLSIGDSAFRECTDLDTVTMPQAKLTKINEYAFYGCSALKKIELCEGITEIEQFAFGQMGALEEITLPSSLKKIGESAFDMYLKKVNIAGLTSWCSIEFANSGSTPLNGGLGSLYIGGEIVKSVTVPDSITSIGDFAFYRCNGLEEVVIGKGVNKIGINAFTFCKSLENVYISDSVSEIGGYAFLQCGKLTVKCEASEPSNGWDENWNPSGCPVVWSSK